MDSTKNLKLVILGLGYVGLPLAVEFSKKRKVIGFDINKKRINDLKNNYDSNGEFSDDDLKVDDTPTLLNSYIDGTSTNLNNDILKKMMQELLVEAQALDNI